MSTVLVVGVPRPVNTAEPVPDALNAPVATSTSLPASRPTTTSVKLPAIPTTVSPDVGVTPVITAEPVPDALNAPVATDIALAATGTVISLNDTC